MQHAGQAGGERQHLHAAFMHQMCDEPVASQVYRCSRRYSALRLSPNAFAAWLTFPLYRASAFLIRNASTSSRLISSSRVRPGRAGRRARSATTHVRVLRQQNGALDDVIQFAHVALPGVVDQRLHRRLIESDQPFAIALRVYAEEVRGQQRNIFLALAQGREWISMVLRRKSRSSRKRPFATSSARSAFVAEMMRTFTRFVFDEPTRSISPISQNPEQLCLQVDGHVGDFVEKQRAAVGQFEAAHAIGLGVGECAFHVAEQLAFEDPSASPPALTVTSGFVDALEIACSVRATTSLPVPVRR